MWPAAQGHCRAKEPALGSVETEPLLSSQAPGRTAPVRLQEVNQGRFAEGGEVGGKRQLEGIMGTRKAVKQELAPKR